MVTATWTSPGQTLAADFQVGVTEAAVRAEVGNGLLPGVQPSDLPTVVGDVVLTDNQTLYDTHVTGRIIPRGVNIKVGNVWPDGGPVRSSGNTGLIDCNSPLVKNFQFDHIRLVPAHPSVWLTGIIGHDYSGTHLYSTHAVDGMGFYNSTTPAADLGIDCEWGLVEGLSYFSPDPNHANDNHTHNDGDQGQSGHGIRLRKFVLCATADPTVGTPSPYSPNVTGQAFTVSPNLSQVYGITLEDVVLHGGAAGFIAILGNQGTPTQPLGTFNRVTVFPDQHLIGGVRRQVVIDPAYTFSGGFQNPDGSPITPIRAAS